MVWYGLIMSRGTKILPEEKENIAKVGYAMKSKNPNTTLTQISKQVDRHPVTVLRAMSDAKFSKYRNDFKKRIDQLRFEAIAEGDARVLKAVKEDKLKPYQLIGMSKTFYEQSFGLLDPSISGGTGTQVNVQIVEGPDKSYSAKVNSDEPK